MLTNALSGGNIGTYLGLFNGSICLPQIIASCLSFALFPAFGSSMPAMILVSGVLRMAYIPEYFQIASLHLTAHLLVGK